MLGKRSPKLEITHWENGNQKTRTDYRADGTKSQEITYWESSGNLKASINYRDDGTTYSEYTYWESGNLKSNIQYRDDGSLSTFVCYKNDSESTRESCHPLRNALPAQYMTLTYYDTGQTKLESYTQYYDAAKTKKYIETTYWENGNKKTSVAYSRVGMRKLGESTYWENGNPKTGIYYQPDGSKKSKENTYWESNGNKKTSIDYRDDGTKNQEYTYWESSANKQKYITYQSDGVTKAYEYTYYENGGGLKASIAYRVDGTRAQETTYAIKYNYTRNYYKQALIKYQPDGTTTLDGYPECYGRWGSVETCTREKHGCTSSSLSCIVFVTMTYYDMEKRKIKKVYAV